LKKIRQALEWPVIVGCFPATADYIPCFAPVFTMNRKVIFIRASHRKRCIFSPIFSGDGGFPPDIGAFLRIIPC
jgi:hypothetical protein